MGLLKQLMIFGKTGLQGLPTRVTLFLRAFSGRQGATSLSTTWDSVAGSGRAPIPGNISGRSRPRNNTHCFRSSVGRPPGQRWILGRGLGLRVGGPGRSPFGARRRSSVWYGTQESWFKFILFSNYTLNTHIRHLTIQRRSTCARGTNHTSLTIIILCITLLIKS